MEPHRVLIMGAAGRDFHNFNTVYRDNPDYQVVAFTATQIPNIEGRVYPAALAGDRYPDGIPIVAEDELVLGDDWNSVRIPVTGERGGVDAPLDVRDLRRS